MPSAESATVNRSILVVSTVEQSGDHAGTEGDALCAERAAVSSADEADDDAHAPGQRARVRLGRLDGRTERGWDHVVGATGSGSVRVGTPCGSATTHRPGSQGSPRTRSHGPTRPWHGRRRGARRTGGCRSRRTARIRGRMGLDAPRNNCASSAPTTSWHTGWPSCGESAVDRRTRRRAPTVGAGSSNTGSTGPVTMSAPVVCWVAMNSANQSASGHSSSSMKTIASAPASSPRRTAVLRAALMPRSSSMS